jgi:heat shock protein HslJ
LIGRQFLSTAVTKDGASFLLAAGTRIRLSFADGQLSANGGCNGISGTLVIDGDKLVLTNVAMTEMGCDQALMSQDNWIATFLGSSPTFTLDGNNLTVTSGTTVVTLLDREVAQPDKPLVGPNWSLTTIFNAEIASSVPQGASASITFAADGTYEMNDGCNAAGGTYVVSGDEIAITEGIHTDMACTGARGEVEGAVLSVIHNGSVKFEIDADSLTLTAGSAGLQFSADPSPTN